MFTNINSVIHIVTEFQNEHIKYNDIYNYFMNNFDNDEIIVIEAIMLLGRECFHYSLGESNYKGTSEEYLSWWIKSVPNTDKELAVDYMLEKAPKIGRYFEQGFSIVAK